MLSVSNTHTHTHTHTHTYTYTRARIDDSSPLISLSSFHLYLHCLHVPRIFPAETGGVLHAPEQAEGESRQNETEAVPSLFSDVQ